MDSKQCGPYGKEQARRLRARGVAVNSVHPARVNGYLSPARMSAGTWRDCRIVAAHPLLDDRPPPETDSVRGKPDPGESGGADRSQPVISDAH
jgi:hypothetical protein